MDKPHSVGVSISYSALAATGLMNTPSVITDNPTDRFCKIPPSPAVAAVVGMSM